MRFASLQGGGAGDYARAGKAVAKSAENIFAVQRKTGPDYGKLSMTAMKTQTEEKIAAMNAEKNVVNAGIKAHANVSKEAIRQGAYREGRKIDSNLRKAGSIAAIGAIAGGAYLASSDPEKGRELPTSKEARDKIMEDHEKTTADISSRREEADTKATSELTALLSGGGNNSNSSSNPSGGGTTPPKADGGNGGSATSSPLSKYNASQMTQLLTKHGLSPDQARIGGAIGMGESGGAPGIDTVASGLDPSKSNEYSVGLFQINTQAHQDKLDRRGWTVEDLRDPDKNAQIAVEVYREAGNSWKPWGAYTNNSYSQYLR